MAAPPGSDDGLLVIFLAWLWRWGGYFISATLGFFWRDLWRLNGGSKKKRTR